MKHYLIAASLAVLAACAPETDGGTVTDQFIGKSLVSADGTTFIFNADGTIDGSFRGTAPITGVYSANSSEVCSTYSSPKQLTGREFCSAPVVSGDTVVFNRRDGSQSPPYTIR